MIGEIGESSRIDSPCIVFCYRRTEKKKHNSYYYKGSQRRLLAIVRMENYFAHIFKVCAKGSGVGHFLLRHYFTLE